MLRRLWIVVVLALLVCSVAMPAAAQETTTPEDDPSAAEDQYAPGPDEECPGARVVNTTVGNGPKQSAPFEITGERFRGTITIAPSSVDPSVSGMDVFVNNANNNAPVATFSKEGPGTDSSLVNEGPGTYFIETNPANAEYAVTIEDCAETAGGNTPVNPSPDPGGGSAGKGDIIPGTIPDKNLPNTGGVPLLGLALLGLAFIGAGASIVRQGFRNR